MLRYVHLIKYVNRSQLISEILFSTSLELFPKAQKTLLLIIIDHLLFEDSNLILC